MAENDTILDISDFNYDNQTTITVTIEVTVKKQNAKLDLNLVHKSEPEPAAAMNNVTTTLQDHNPDRGIESNIRNPIGNFGNGTTRQRRSFRLTNDAEKPNIHSTRWQAKKRRATSID